MKNTLNQSIVSFFFLCIFTLFSCSSDDSGGDATDDSNSLVRTAQYSITANGNGLTNATVTGTVVDNVTSFYLQDLDPVSITFTLADESNQTSMNGGFSIVGEILQDYNFTESTEGQQFVIAINAVFDDVEYNFIFDEMGTATISEVELVETQVSGTFFVRKLVFTFSGEFVNIVDSNIYTVSGSFEFTEE